MLVAVNGFGSIWTCRFGRDSDSATRCARNAAYYNTTGVSVHGSVRARSRVYGVARFNGNSGFTPHHPARMLHRVFECAEPERGTVANQILFRKLIAVGNPTPDRYMIAVTDSTAGWMERESAQWKSPECFLLSFSESDAHQEALLLMPAFGWIYGSSAFLVLTPHPTRPASARLIAHSR